jgi:hypothetical protein
MKKLGLSILLLITATTSLSCKRSQFPEYQGIAKSQHLPPLDRSKDRPLAPMVVSGVTFRRTEQTLRGVHFVILHKTQHFFSTNSISSQHLAGFLLGGNLLCSDDGNPWCSPKALLTFNCHAFALGDRAGLTPQDWVEGEPGALTEGANPMAVLVSYYLTPYKKLSKDPREIAELASDPGINEGDVIAFMRIDAGDQVVFVHSGKMVKVEGENWVISKLGERPVSTLPIKNLAAAYDPKFSWIAVFK